MEELLRFENVSFIYEDGAEQRLALKDCSVSIGAGERVAVLGSNGAGKSTFFLLANGVLCPKQGNIFFRGDGWIKMGCFRNMDRIILTGLICGRISIWI